MVRSAGAAALAVIMMFGAFALTASAQAASATPTVRKHIRQPAYAARPYYPAYYGRPVVYAPAPFVPIPPLFG